jgi:hypothetical protein
MNFQKIKGKHCIGLRNIMYMYVYIHICTYIYIYIYYVDDLWFVREPTFVDHASMILTYMYKMYVNDTFGVEVVLDFCSVYWLMDSIVILNCFNWKCWF